MADKEKKKSNFLVLSLALIAMAFAIGFVVSLIRYQKAGILLKFAVQWEIFNGILFVASWLPAIVFVASTLATESFESKGNYSSTISAIITPAFILTALLSIFSILIVPFIESKVSAINIKSSTYYNSLKYVNDSMAEKNYQIAKEHIQICLAIDSSDEINELANKINIEFNKASHINDEQNNQSQTESKQNNNSADNSKANRFYLLALEAEKKGNYFDAHYLAKRAATFKKNNPDINKLIANTWSELQKKKFTPQEIKEKNFYNKKVEGYTFYQEGNYLEAYKIFLALSEEDSTDIDVQNYLKKSKDGLETVSFFLQEEQRAITSSGSKAIDLKMKINKNPDKSKEPENVEVHLKSDAVVSRLDAVYFTSYGNNDGILYYEKGKDYVIEVKAKHARLNNNTLILRAVDKDEPEIVTNPEYIQDTRSKAQKSSGPFIIEVPFTDKEASMVLALSSSNPKDIPIAILATGLGTANKFNIDISALLAELARRIAFPFAIIILVLLGTALGMHFTPVEKPSIFATAISAPILTFLISYPMKVITNQFVVIAKAIAKLVPRNLFISAWVILLIICIVVCLFASAKIVSLTEEAN